MRVAVIGAGIVGLACAEELVRGGHDVHVLDPHPATGATHAAAGMLAPAGEAWHGEGALLRLGLASARLWPEYATRLVARSGRDVGFRQCGTLLVGHDRDDLQQVVRTVDLLTAEGIACRELDGREVRRHEPTLARVAGGALLPDDHAVDPRRTAQALLRLLGDRVVRATAVAVEHRRVVLADAPPVPCDAVVVATGVDARAWVPCLRPVRGETVRLRTVDPPSRVLRAHVQGERVYVVPRRGGEVVVGATEEEHPGPPTATVGAVLRLLGAARTLLPGLETAEVLDITARHRPGTPDNGPLLGLRGVGDGFREVLAVGHYRAGVLLAPLTALVVRAHVEDTPVPSEALPFTPARFLSPPEPATSRPNTRTGGS